MSSLNPATALRLRSQLDALAPLLDGVPDEALERAPGPGKWSARLNLAHLARYQDVFAERLERILREDGVALPRYRAEDDPGWAEWAAVSVPEIVARLTARRRALVDRLERVSPADLQRTAVHPALGPMTLPVWLEFFLLHEAHHLLAVLKLGRDRSVSTTAAPSPRSTLHLLSGELAVVRLPPGAPVPAWARSGPVSSVVWTRAETSIVCAADAVPPGEQAERGWRVFALQGPIPFATTGVLNGLTEPLARKGISLFAFSTYDTDYLMVKADVLAAAEAALRAAGHEVISA
jgi:hypothetical protein